MRWLIILLLAVTFAMLAQEPATQFPAKAEYYFVRMEYKDLPGLRRGYSRGWWRQDWPEADVHFTQGINRLTRVNIGEPRHMPLTDERIFDHPWIYATQVAYWDLTDLEITRLREYLLRGGFLVVDDFYGPEWEVFAATMKRLRPSPPRRRPDHPPRPSPQLAARRARATRDGILR